jgi:hypothetical protein
MNYTLIDLKIIAAELEHHFRKSDLAEYTGQCLNCWAEVTQSMNECPDCQRPVVWLNSPVWDSLYGSAKLRISELEGVIPTTEAGKYLCTRCNVIGFANRRELEDWVHAERQMGSDDMRRIVDYATLEKRGRGAMAHALAIVRKKLRELPHKQKQEEPSPTTTKML